MKKRLFAILLVFAMAFALPLTASAADPAKPESPAEIFALSDGSFLVSDTWNKVVWKIADGEAALFAGNIAPKDIYGEPVGRYSDGAKADAYFIEPRGIAPFGDGWAVADAGANVVRFVSADGTVQTLAGNGRPGSWDGIGSGAYFDRPVGIAAGDDGCVYVADSGNDAIRRIAKDGYVTTVATNICEPAGIAWADGWLYVAESGANRVVRVKDGAVEVLAGLLEPAEDDGVFYGGYADGPVERARFDHPDGILVDEDGTVYVTETLNHTIRAIADGRVRTVSRSADTLSFPAEPVGLAMTADGLAVADRYTGEVGTVTTKLQFSDVADGDWFAPYVEEAVLRGIVEGDNGVFLPLNTVSAAEFVTMLSRVAKSDDGSVRIDANETPDGVSANDWYVKEARWAAANGLTEAISDWTAPLTRYQIAQILYLFADAQGYDVTERADLSAFPDADDIGTGEGTAVANIRNAFQWAVAKKIFEGNEGYLFPLSSATRAEATKVVIALMDAYGL